MATRQEFEARLFGMPEPPEQSRYRDAGDNDTRPRSKRRKKPKWERPTKLVPDVIVENHGSLCLVRPKTEESYAWLKENTGLDAQWFGLALAVEPRFLDDLLAGIEAEGFTYDWERR